VKIVLSEPLMYDYLPDLERATGHRHEWRIVAKVDSDVLAETDILVGGSLPAELAAEARRLRLVQAPGAGYENIALSALPPGVVVANTFHHGRSMAEYVVMVTLALTRRLYVSDGALRAGRWLSPVYVKGYDRPDTLRGKTAGIIGLGEIGSEVARLFAAFDMTCVGIRRNVAKPLPSGVDLAWTGGTDQLGKLLAEADVVVVTVPLSEETRGLVGAEELRQMKPDALLVNVARGPVVDEEALYAALAERRIGGAALDVWWQYPDAGGVSPPGGAAFGDLDNVVVTPHVSGVTTETFAGRVEEIAANINRLEAGEPLANVLRGL
jgi:phosphoglycerate dehydrogenase-like enzyme